MGFNMIQELHHETLVDLSRLQQDRSPEAVRSSDPLTVQLELAMMVGHSTIISNRIIE